MTVITRLTPAASHILDTVPTATTTTAPAGTAAPTNNGTGGIKDELNRYLNPAGAAGTTAPAADGTATPPAAGSTTTAPADTTTTPPAGGTAAPQVPTSQ